MASHSTVEQGERSTEWDQRGDPHPARSGRSERRTHGCVDIKVQLLHGFQKAELGSLSVLNTTATTEANESYHRVSSVPM